jgi:hypothetical protein
MQLIWRQLHLPEPLVLTERPLHGRFICRAAAEAPPLIHHHLIRSPDHQSTATSPIAPRFFDTRSITSLIRYTRLGYQEGRNATTL